MKLYSKRNSVFLIGSGPSERVEKHFRLASDWEWELAVYRQLSGHLPIPKLLASGENVLILEYLPFPTLLDVLESQEHAGFRSEPWEAFAQWVRQCHDYCGMVCGDGNLRNFLWDELESRCVGLDFEGYRRGELPEAGSNLVAYLMEYDPADSPVKRQAASILRSELGVSDSSIHAIRQELRLRRSIKAAGANGTSAQRGAGLRRMSITGDFGKVSE